MARCITWGWKTGIRQPAIPLHCFYFLYKLPTLLKVGFVQLAGPQKQSPIDYLIMTGWMPSQRCPTYCANLLNYHDLDGVCLSGNKTITYFLTYFWPWLQRWKNSNKKQSLPSTEKMRVLVKCRYSDSFTRFRRRRSVLIVLTSAVNMCSTVKDSAKHSHCITTKFDYYNYHAKKTVPHLMWWQTEVTFATARHCCWISDSSVRHKICKQTTYSGLICGTIYHFIFVTLNYRFPSFAGYWKRICLAEDRGA